MTESQLDPRALRDAFGAFMTGVTVVTAKADDGTPRGFTANSFSSVSLDPPLLLVSIAKTSSNFQVFSKTEGFAVNILSESQKPISNAFSRPVQDRFAGVDWHWGPYGAPILQGVSAWFDCALHQTVDAGDHAILLGRVVAFHAGTAAGLGYYRGSYFTPAQELAALGPKVVVAAIIEQGAKVLLVDDGDGGLTLPTAGGEGAGAAITRLIATLGVNAEAGMIYAVYEDRARAQQHIAMRCAAADDSRALGQYVELTTETLARLRDPAMREMLERLGRERQMGNYGIYFGNEATGRVLPLGEQP